MSDAAPWLRYYGNEIGNLTRQQIVDFLYAVAGRTCIICGRYLRRVHASIDHVIPRSKGGAHHVTNWALAHRACNGEKGNRMPTAEELARHRRSQRRIFLAILRIRLTSWWRRLWP